MKRAARIDGNQDELVTALRGMGCSVQLLTRVGDGCPDALIGLDGIVPLNLIAEFKIAAGKLNEEQEKWHQAWRGQKAVLRTVEDCVRLVKAARLLQATLSPPASNPLSAGSRR